LRRPDRLRAVKEIAGHILSAYSQLLDEKVPELVEGVYLVGSLAMADFHDGASDIDFVALIRTTPTAEQVAELAEVHGTIAGRFARPYLDGLYLTRADLAAGPFRCEPVPAVHIHKFLARSSFGQDPITWVTRATRGVVFGGVALGELDIWNDKDALIEWVRRNVTSYWIPWVRRCRPLLTPSGLSALTEWSVAWGVLGIARMHYTVETGDITSKRGAGEYALDTFDPQWRRSLRKACASGPGQRNDRSTDRSWPGAGMHWPLWTW
jgi:Domain of unknown function (DUF4111)